MSITDWKWKGRWPLFLLTPDETEKSGWEDRNSKREYFAHCDSMVAREKSLLRAIELLKTPIPASRIIGVTIDFETIKKVASKPAWALRCFAPKPRAKLILRLKPAFCNLEMVLRRT